MKLEATKRLQAGAHKDDPKVKALRKDEFEKILETVATVEKMLTAIKSAKNLDVAVQYLMSLQNITAMAYESAERVASL